MPIKTNPFDQPGTLMEVTQRKLLERGVPQAYAETRLPFYWLQKFAGGGFRNPSVNRVQFLYEHLLSTKLIG